MTVFRVSDILITFKNDLGEYGVFGQEKAPAKKPRQHTEGFETLIGQSMGIHRLVNLID